jgi:hypothetical protein
VQEGGRQLQTGALLPHIPFAEIVENQIFWDCEGNTEDTVLCPLITEEKDKEREEKR